MARPLRLRTGAVSVNRSTAENRLQLLISEELAARPPANLPSVTESLTRAVCAWLPEMGANKVRREVLRPNALGLLEGARPRYDVVGTWPSGARLVVEIDRFHKPYSLVKLRDVKARGDRALWVRWRNGRDTTLLLADVPVIWVDVGAWARNERRLILPDAT